jgi:hypothetical protein
MWLAVSESRGDRQPILVEPLQCLPRLRLKVVVGVTNLDPKIGGAIRKGRRNGNHRLARRRACTRSGQVRSLEARAYHARLHVCFRSRSEHVVPDRRSPIPLASVCKRSRTNFSWSSANLWLFGLPTLQGSSASSETRNLFHGNPGRWLTRVARYLLRYFREITPESASASRQRLEILPPAERIHSLS